jgi:hypothetical protein
LFVVGRRTRKFVVEILTAGFAGWLMTDGYMAYRNFDQKFCFFTKFKIKVYQTLLILVKRTKLYPMLFIELEIISVI